MPRKTFAQQAHDYMPPELAAQMPALYATEQQGDDAIVYAHYFTPDSGWDWYATEYSPEDDQCFGLVSGSEIELDYFSIGELRFARGPWGLRIERDLLFRPCSLRDIRKQLDRKHDPNDAS